MAFDYDSMQLEILDISPKISKPAIYITKGKLTFNKFSIDELHNTEYAQYCINKECKVLAVKECSQNDFKATRFANKNSNKNGVTFFSKVVQSVIALLISDYDDEGKYVVFGEYSPKTKTMYYDFNNIQFVDNYFPALLSEARFYKLSDGMLEESNNIDKDLENSNDNVELNKKDNPKYELVHTEKVYSNTNKRQSNGKGISWKPICIEVYLNDELLETCNGNEVLIAHNNDKIKLISSKQVTWGGYARKTIDVINRDVSMLEFVVHAGRSAITYASKISKGVNGEREKGQILIFVD